MTIAGKSFILLFLPLSLLIYWRILRTAKARLWFLFIASYVFYVFADLPFVPLLFGLSAATFWLAKRQRMILGIFLNIFMLCLFKYWNFGAESWNAVAGAFHIPFLIPLFDFTLPLGISFFVFKHIGYLLDVQQHRYPATQDFLAFATFSAYFPQIGAGPISSFHDTGRQLRSIPATLSSDELYQGILHLTMGLAKKVLIADVLSKALAPQLLPQPQSTTAVWTWFSVIVFALQLYFDFSGYTDIALGISYMLGISLPGNFNNPYLASSPADFWQRWHISLSDWFRVYFFSPLSRRLLKGTHSRHPERAQYVANLATMCLIGLWHGANWTYIVWGVYHAMLLNLHAWANRRRLKLRIPYVGGLLFAVALLGGWAVFLSPTLDYASRLVANMLGAGGIGSVNDLAVYGPVNVLVVLVAGFVAVSGVAEAANVPRDNRAEVLVAMGLLTALCVLRMGDLAQFVYVQF